MKNNEIKLNLGLSHFVVIIIGFIVLLSFYKQALAVEVNNSLQTFKIITLPDNKIQLQLGLTNTIQVLPEAITLQNPARLVLDFKNVSNNLSQPQLAIQNDIIQGLMAVEGDGKTRVIVNLKQATPYQLKPDGKNVLITFDQTTPSQPNVTFKKISTASQYKLLNINFNKTDGGVAQIALDLSNPEIPIDIRQDGSRLMVDLTNTNFSKNMKKSFDAASSGTPVQAINLQAHDNNSLLQIDTKGPFEHLAYQLNNRFIIEIKPTLAAANRMNEMTSDNTAVSVAKNSKDKLLSLNFQDIKVRSVLQLLAEFTGLNIVTSDSVQGSLTLRLQNVPWEQALAIILRSQGLEKRQIGNVLLIAPAEEVMAREKQELEAGQQVADLAPLKSLLIQINYGKAADIATLLKGNNGTLLSNRGNVSVDARTNTVWVQDTPQRLLEIRKLIQSLDKPAKQVLIEARIVSIDTNYEKQLGIRFGVTKPTHISGSFNAANQINNGVDPGFVLDPAGKLVDPTQRLNVNLPAASIDGSPAASMAIALAKLGHGTLLDLELSALESEGNVEIISSPRLITANQQPAIIQSGEEIPYQEATSSGATSVTFKDAVLKLSVTPQITPDGKIILNLQVNQDQDSGKTFANVPTINTRAIQTQVLVDNGETVVLGGIYEQTKTNNLQRVPFLGSLPVIGSLFRHTQNVDKRTELLIFVTPKIIRPATESSRR